MIVKHKREKRGSGKYMHAQGVPQTSSNTYREYTIHNLQFDSCRYNFDRLKSREVIYSSSSFSASSFPSSSHNDDNVDDLWTRIGLLSQDTIE